MRRKIVVICLYVFAAVPLNAQSAGVVTPEMRAAANDAFQKQDWASAVAAYERIVSAEEKNAGGRYRLGLSLLALKRNDEAIKYLEAAQTISPNPVFALALARGYARTGNTSRMYEVLDGSLKLGGIAPESITAEADFAPFKADPRFLAFVDRSDKTVNPCKARPEHRQFDFWIGEWLPKNTQGITVGTSSIQLILGGCIIFENWSTPVSSGKSFNLFNTSDGKWHQTWVDDKGRWTEYVGGLVDGKMVLDSVSTQNGKKVIARMTFSQLPNGDVRQHGQNSSDEGKTWTTTFDFIYVRKPGTN